ncbi:putative protein kinase [Legionella geestiana]|uniref:Protein kinase domain-containing protein n=1 Tax=Legionella geestiana TaxID=45065 RepID=A0A0W0U563_9GAMM|nr:protein kinase [Legionella geestiana]KTD03048.1 putative protein kinase [Legionella geestiana]STX52959.1 Serine/threonine protein kinase [Legionella geestiana]
MQSKAEIYVLNPLTLESAGTEVLIQFLDAHPGIAFFDKHILWNFEPIGEFRLTHSILRRPRKRVLDEERPGLRYEVLSNSLLGKGTYNRVYHSRATLISEHNRHIRRTKEEGRERIVKRQNLEDADEVFMNTIRRGQACAQRTYHLHAKPAVFVGSRCFEVERRMPGDELFNLLNNEEKDLLSTLILFRMTFAVLQAYRQQVTTPGFIHRDVKPENIFVRMPPDGSLQPIEVNIIDYGFCMEADAHEEGLVGSPLYCAPEIWECEQASHASDIYSLGRTLAFIWRDAHPIWNSISNAELRAFSSDVCHDALFANIPHFDENTKAAIRNLLARMTDPKAEMRPNIDEVIAGFTNIATDYYLNGSVSPGIPATHALRQKMSELRERNHVALAEELQTLAEGVELAWLKNSPAVECEQLRATMRAMKARLCEPRTHTDIALTALGNAGILLGGLGFFGAIGLAATSQKRGSFFWHPKTDTADTVSALRRQLPLAPAW